MIKVLHLISGGDTGGAKTHVFTLVDALYKYYSDEVDVSVGCFIKGEFYKEILEKKHIKTYLFSQKHRGDMSVHKKLLDLIDKEDFNIIHLHGARANFVVAPLLNKLKIPVITTVHSDYMLDFAGNPFKWLFYTPLNIAAIKKIKYRIGVSNAFKKMLVSRGFMPSSIYTVYNGIDVEKEHPIKDKESFAKECGFTYDCNKKYVCILARLDKVKSVDVFIKGAAEICKKRDDVEFLIAGDGEEKNKLTELATTLGISSKIHFLGFINDVYSLLDMSDVNTLTSQNESFPYSMLEGGLLSKPTVCTNAGGMPDMIINNKTGLLFEKGDYNQFAECVIKLLDNEILASKLGGSLKKHIIENFSCKSFACMNLDAYKKAIHDSKREKKYDAVLSGYYGFDNSGDDALMYAIESGLKSIQPDVKIAVLAHKPKKLMLETGYDAYNRFDFLGIKRLFADSKLLLSGGGTLITDITSRRSLFYYLTVIRLAVKGGLSTMIYGSGIGPVEKKNYKIIKNVLDKTDAICVREKLSLSELKKIGVNSSVPCRLTADPALTLNKCDDWSYDSSLAELGLAPKSYFIISVRKYSNADSKTIAKACDEICRKYGVTPLFLCMKYPDDILAAKACANYMSTDPVIVQKKLSVSKTIAIVDSSKFVLSMRLHTLVYAASCGIPIVALSGDQKLQAFLEYCNNNNCLKLDGVSSEDITNSVDKALSEDNSAYLNRVNELKKLARINAQIAVDLLNQK